MLNFVAFFTWVLPCLCSGWYYFYLAGCFLVVWVVTATALLLFFISNGFAHMIFIFVFFSYLSFLEDLRFGGLGSLHSIMIDIPYVLFLTYLCDVANYWWLGHYNDDTILSLFDLYNCTNLVTLDVYLLSHVYRQINMQLSTCIFVCYSPCKERVIVAFCIQNT